MRTCRHGNTVTFDVRTKIVFRCMKSLLDDPWSLVLINDSLVILTFFVLRFGKAGES